MNQSPQNTRKQTLSDLANKDLTSLKQKIKTIIRIRPKKHLQKHLVQHEKFESQARKQNKNDDLLTLWYKSAKDIRNSKTAAKGQN